MWRGIVKVISVIILSFCLGWILYSCSHEDPILKEDYEVEERKAERLNVENKIARDKEDKKAAEEGYQRFDNK